MATYFDFKKKHPHINIDDVFVKRGEVIDDKLVLEYSIEELDPLSISLSAFDNIATCITDAEFKDNTLVFKHNRKTADLSVDLTPLDKHVSEVKKADDGSILSLCFNDGTFLSVSMAEFATDHYVTSCYIDNNNLIVERNGGLPIMAVDLDKFSTHIVGASISGNDLLLRYNDGTPALTVALDRFHKHIANAQIDECDQLTLGYVDGVADALSVDLSKYARNYYVNEASLCGDVIVLKRNSADAGNDLSVELSTLNNYIESADIDGKTLVLTYNSDRLAPLSIDIADFIKDYYIADAKLCADNKLHLKYNKDLDDITVDLSQLNDHIVDIKHENDILQFVRTNGSLPAVNLAKYVNNNLSTMHIHGNSLVLKFDDGRTKDVSLDAFDKHIESYEADDNNLSLFFNDGKGCIVISKQKLGKVSATRIEDNTLWLYYSDGSDPISVKLPEVEVPDMYLSAGKLEDSQLVLEYADPSKNVSVDMSELKQTDEYVNGISLNGNELNFTYNVDRSKDKTVSLSAFDNELLSSVFVGNVLSCKFANGKDALIDFCKFNKFTQAVSLVGNVLTLADNTGSILTVDLTALDRYANDFDSKNGVLTLKYKNTTDTLDIPLTAVNYEVQSGEVATDADSLALKFTNGKSDVVIDTSKLNVHVENAEIVNKKLKLSLTNHTPIEVDLGEFANAISDVEYTNDNIILNFANGRHTTLDLGKFNMFINNAYVGDSTNANKLILTYNNPARPHLEIDLDKFDKHIESAEVADGKLNARFNNNKGIAFSVPLADINYELESGEVDDEYQLALNFSNGKEQVVVDASKLKSPDTYISSIVLDANDNLVFDYNVPEPAAKAVCLHKFSKNDFIANGRYDLTSKKLILDYNQQEGFDKRNALSIEIPTGGGSGENYFVNNGNYDEATDKLVLSYNTDTIQPLSISFPQRQDIDINVLSDMHFMASDEPSILSIAQAIQQIVTAFGGNRQN